MTAVTPRGNTCSTQEIGTLSTFHQQSLTAEATPGKTCTTALLATVTPKPVDHYYIQVYLFFFYFFFHKHFSPGESCHCDFPYHWQRNGQEPLGAVGKRKEAGWCPGGNIEQEVVQLSTRVLVPSLTVELGKTSWFPLPLHQDCWAYTPMML